MNTKRHLVFLVSLCSLAMVGCASEDVVGDTPTSGEEFQANISVSAGSAETRMTHDDNATDDATYAWEKSTDHLGLFCSALKTQNQDLTAQGSGTYAGFTKDAVTFTTTGNQNFYAYYPYSSSVGGTSSAATGFNLPGNQGDGKSWAKYSLAYSNKMTANVAANGSVSPKGDMTHLFAYLKFAFRCEEQLTSSSDIGTEFAATNDYYWQVASVTVTDASATTVGNAVNSLAGDYTVNLTDHTYSFTGNKSSSLQLTSEAFTGTEITKEYNNSNGTSIRNINSKDNNGTGSMMVVPTNSNGNFVLNGKTIIVKLNKVRKTDNKVISSRSRTRVLDSSFADVAAGDVTTVGLKLEDIYSGPLWEDESALVTNIVYAIEKPDETIYTNLASKGAANCYIIPTSGMTGFNKDGKYFIPVVKGDGSTIDGVSGEYIAFTVKGNGNAVIAYPDNSPSSTSPKKWSWHIWAPSTYPGDDKIVTYSSSGVQKSYTIMNMDLGSMEKATSTSASTESNHTLYQWGRKDPFSNLNYVYMYGSLTKRQVGDGTNGSVDGSYTWPRTEASTTTGTMAYTYENPEIYLTQPSADDNNSYVASSTHYRYDWLYGVDHNTSDSRWGNPYPNDRTSGSETAYKAGNHTSNYGKSVNDPCPYGYKVAPMDTWNRMLRGENYRTTTTYGVQLISMDEKQGNNTYTTSEAFYPYAGYRNPKYASMGAQNGSNNTVKTQGNWWSSSPYSYQNDLASGMLLTSGSTKPMYGNSRCDGRMVRCVKIQ